MKFPITYLGGKTRLASQIAALLPEHQHYVEPFCGSLAVLLAKAPAPHETVNDLDRHLVTFWRVLREQPDDLERVCALTPHSRLEQELSYRLDDDQELDELEVARLVWVQLTQGRAGVRTPTGWRHYERPVGATGMPRYLAGYVGRMAPATARLRSVSLECRPAEEVIRSYGKHEDVLLYVDPPYPDGVRNNQGRTNNGYVVDMRSDVEHGRLLGQLMACRAAVVLSGYPYPLYDACLSDWYRHEITTYTGQGGTNAARTEVLWSNRPWAASSEVATA